LVLPLTRLAPPAGPPPEQTPRLRVRLREGARPCHLLVVEDDPDSRAILVQTLAALGAEVAQARQGLEAMAVLERQPVDLVFTDIRMPELDGLDLLRRIRQRWGAALPVVAVSASNLEHERRFYIGEGFQDFVGKPYGLQQIHRLLLQYLPGQWTEESAADTAVASAEGPRSLAAAGAAADRASPATAPSERLALLQRLAAAARDGDVVAVRQTHQALLALLALSAPPGDALDADTAQRIAEAVQHYDFDTLATLAERQLALAIPGGAP
ncbi:MAG TPA: response regulator, partial [Burkholderiaceae bacterium]|nr:response regulator [Burkholderiaceae bacterium]